MAKITVNERLLVGAVLERLVSGRIFEGDLRDIVAFAVKIPTSEKIIRHDVKSERGANKKAVGFTPEHGNIAVGNREDSFEEKYEGFYFERIGYYRMWREFSGEIRFQHWRSDFNKMGNEQGDRADSNYPIYYISYVKESFLPLSFGIIKCDIISKTIYWPGLVRMFLKALIHCLKNPGVEIKIKAFNIVSENKKEELWSAQ